MNNSFQNSFGSDDSQKPTLSAAEATGGETSGDLSPKSPDASAPPEFGLLDVIEAFTAMRHEWRTQTRENRDLATAIQGANDNLLRLETKLLASAAPAEQNAEQKCVRALVEAIVEIDLHLGRAVDATVNSQQASSPAELLAEAIEDDFASRGFVARWFGRGFFQSVMGRFTSHLQAEANNSTHEGLTMVIERIRKIMSDRDIARVETLGRPFDAATMHAIASIESDQQPAGHVEEQIAAAYFWRGELFRYADVRVAK
jgi:molecular chaperone GrpE